MNSTEPPMQRPDSPTPHVTDEQLAGYLDRALPPEQRAQVEDHLAECFQCRDELLANARVIRRSKNRLTRYLGPPLAVAAAAAILLVVVPRDGDSRDQVLRDSGDAVTETPRVSAISPADGERIGGQDITFVWSAVPGEPRYRFALTNADGDEVWSQSLTDTILALPDEINLTRGVTYLWYVDALLLDGRSVATEVRAFQLTP